VYLGAKLPALPAGFHCQWQHKYDINQYVNNGLPELPSLLLNIEILRNKNNIKFYQNQWHWWQRWQLQELCFV